MAHEMGHNFGMNHDSPGCCLAQPDDGGCIMAAATGWEPKMLYNFKPVYISKWWQNFHFWWTVTSQTVTNQLDIIVNVLQGSVPSRLQPLQSERAEALPELRRGEVLVQPSQHQCHVRGPALWKRIPGGRRRVWLWGSGGQERVALLPLSRFLPRCYSDWSFTLTFSISVSFTTKECSSPCCNANNCTLKIGAECAHGVCCHECKVNPCQTHLTLSLYTLSCGAASGKL